MYIYKIFTQYFSVLIMLILEVKATCVLIDNHKFYESLNISFIYQITWIFSYIDWMYKLTHWWFSQSKVVYKLHFNEKFMVCQEEIFYDYFAFSFKKHFDFSVILHILIRIGKWLFVF